MTENRLLKGYQYFKNIPPSKQNPVSWVYLHKWFSLLEESLGKKIEGEEDLETVAQMIFGKAS